ncbi:MAG: hypothetical protein HC819_00100 [Cyclobacteriaceae bacterium]|nr:hypothetical protein [Cyclobacteriaceae bacterium]
MRRAFILLWILQPSFFCWSQTQIIDDFTDGEITNSPIWLGDISNFSVNTDQQLQLTAPPVSGKSYISTSSEVINEAEWSFYVKLDFNPSSGNYLDVYLVSDQENLKGELNGYFVRIGSTQDDVCLYKQNQSTKQKMVDGTDHQIDASQVLLHINVTKNADNTWELQVDYGQSGLYISEGTAVDDEHLFSGYFGLLCTYTSTRADKFFFDDLYISGKNHGDDRAPGIDAGR